MKSKMSDTMIGAAERDGRFGNASARWAIHASALAIMTAALAAPQAALAQESEGAGEIVVTGSRVTRSTFTSPTPITVIGAQQIENMAQVSVAEAIATIPQNVASQSDTNVGLTGSTSTYNIGAQVANLRGLNPFRSVRTLTLVNTKRFVPSTTGSAVDTNMIPSLLVDRVETVTGGASAAYGTDALAGVVNIILDTDFDGFKLQGDFGQTFQNDGETSHIAAAWGTDFAGGRGHTIFGLEYQDSRPVGDCSVARQWCAASPDAFINEANATNGLPRYIRGDDGAYANYDLSLVIRASTLGARVNPPGLRSLVFSDDGRTVSDYDKGQFFQAIGFNAVQGGECGVDCSVWSEVQLRPEVERWALYSHSDFEFTNSLKGIFEASFGHREAFTKSLSLGPASANPIYSDNFYLQGVTYLDRATGTTIPFADLLAANAGFTGNAGGASRAPGAGYPLFIGKHMRNVPGARSQTSTDLDTWRIMAALEGDIGGSWGWDAYYQYGKTEQSVIVDGLRVNSFFSYAIDAVEDPNNPGNPICRALLPGPANTTTIAGGFQLYNNPNAAGCLPLNLLGTNTENPAATAYAYRTATEDFTYEQHVVAGNIHGDLFQLPAGPVGFAVGGEYRFETGDTEHNRLPFDGAFSVVAFGADFGGDLEILEGYVEGNIPLLRDVPLVDALELNLAYRRTEQTNTDGITGQSKDIGVDTWKVSGTWDVTDWLRFRATRSQDIRAAPFVDLYYNEDIIPPGPPAGTALNRWNLNAQGIPINDAAEIRYPPNFALAPEEGDTTTYGIVLAPGGPLEGLRFSVDYYKIEIANAISILTTQQTVDACFIANVGCDKIFDEVTGAAFSTLTAAQRTNIGRVDRGSQNIGSFETEGIDIEVAYRLPLDRINMAGDLTFRGLATIVDSFLVDLGNGAAPIDYAGQVGGAAFGGFVAPPDYTITTFVTYDVGGFSATVDTKFYPEGIYDIRRSDTLPNTNANSINDNTVDSRFYVGLAASYSFDEHDNSSKEVFFAIRNLFNIDPPSSPADLGGTGGRVQGVGHPTNPVYYDVLGAQWRMGFRLKY